MSKDKRTVRSPVQLLPKAVIAVIPGVQQRQILKLMAA